MWGNDIGKILSVKIFPQRSPLLVEKYRVSLTDRCELLISVQFS